MFKSNRKIDREMAEKPTIKPMAQKIRAKPKQITPRTPELRRKTEKNQTKLASRIKNPRSPKKANPKFSHQRKGVHSKSACVP
jgi:hypothetical protein